MPARLWPEQWTALMEGCKAYSSAITPLFFPSITAAPSEHKAIIFLLEHRSISYCFNWPLYTFYNTWRCATLYLATVNKICVHQTCLTCLNVDHLIISDSTIHTAINYNRHKVRMFKVLSNCIVLNISNGRGKSQHFVYICAKPSPIYKPFGFIKLIHPHIILCWSSWMLIACPVLNIIQFFIHCFALLRLNLALNAGASAGFFSVTFLFAANRWLLLVSYCFIEYNFQVRTSFQKCISVWLNISFCAKVTKPWVFISIFMSVL